ADVPAGRRGGLPKAHPGFREGAVPLLAGDGNHPDAAQEDGDDEEQPACALRRRAKAAGAAKDQPAGQDPHHQADAGRGNEGVCPANVEPKADGGPMPQVQTLTQFSVFLVNKPGVLAQVTAALAQAKINLLAVTLVDSQEHGVLRMVTADATEAR